MTITKEPDYAWDFFNLRKEINVWFGNLPENLSHSIQPDFINYGLDTGKFLLQVAIKIDPPADFVFYRSSGLPHCKSVSQLGEEIRLASLARLDGSDVALSSSVQSFEIRKLHAAIVQLQEQVTKLDGMRGAK